MQVRSLFPGRRCNWVELQNACGRLPAGSCYSIFTGRDVCLRSVPTDRDVGRLELAHWALCQVPGTRQCAANRLRSLRPARMQLEKDFTPTQHLWTLPPSEDSCPLCLVAVDVLVMYLVHPSLSTSHTPWLSETSILCALYDGGTNAGPANSLASLVAHGLAASAILMTRSTQGENSLTCCQLAVCLPCFCRPS
jgi:hypothetical protein